jgi:predicted nucleotidyltransferase
VNEPLRTTLADAANFLQSHGVSYALIGGLAVSYRGQPRATADVDMVIAADTSRALSLAEALATSRFRPLFPDVTDVIEKSLMLPLRHRQTNVKVDLAIGLSGFEQQAVSRAEQVDFSGTLVSVASAEDLLIMKVLAGRPQDEHDLQGLVIAQGSRLDWDYCLRVAAELGQAIDQDLLGRIHALRRDHDS